MLSRHDVPISRSCSESKRKIIYSYDILTAVVLSIITQILLVANAYAGISKRVEVDDYNKWYTLSMTSERLTENIKNISEDGEWISYYAAFESDSDANEIRIASLVGDTVYSLRRAIPGRFSVDGKWYFYRIDGGGVGLLDLRNGKSRLFEDGVSFDVFDNPDVVLIHVTKKSSISSGDKGLLLLDLRDNKQHLMDGYSYSSHASSGKVAYATLQQGMHVIKVADIRSPGSADVVVASAGHRYNSLAWDKSGYSLAFSREELSGENRQIGIYSEGEGLEMLGEKYLAQVKSSASGLNIADGPLLVSDNRDFVLFNADLVETSHTAGVSEVGASLVEIWNSRAEHLPGPGVSRVQRSAMAWWPAQNKVVAIEDDEQYFAALTADHRFAVTLKERKERLPDGYGLDYSGRSADVFIVDTFTGERRLVVEEVSGGVSRHLSLSPGGRYIAYFNKRSWWIYDIELDVHNDVGRNVNDTLVVPWPDEASHSLSNTNWMGVSHGNAGWAGDDDGFLFYDEFDIWLAPLDGRELRRITNGRENKIIFRSDNSGNIGFGSFSRRSTLFEGRRIDLDSGIILKMFGANTKRSGYAILDASGGITSITYDDILVDFIESVPSGDGYVYRRQRFDLPPELVFADMNSSVSKVVVKSNVHHFEYSWGRAELISYPGPGGRILQGVLYYPSDYVKENIYPMIVDIYQVQSNSLHRYFPPSMDFYKYVASFTQNGYFVLRPDIAYRANDPGFSALECVTAGVEYVVQRGMVDQRSIGLMGHSFGGYETAFIVTQTDMFSAAVAGSAFTNLISTYGGMSGRFPSLFRLEAQQFRMPSPLYESPERYLANSPVHNVAGVNTPLLLWTGDRDPTVPHSHSVEMFNLLRRTAKKHHVMLVYPNVAHFPTTYDVSADLHNRVMSWFEFYLKGAAPEDWMIQGAVRSNY